MPALADSYAFLDSHKVMLAPMAGVSDVAMRQLCRQSGATLAFTEMVSSKGLSYSNKKTADLLDLAPGEEEVGIQLFGHEPLVMAQSAAWASSRLGGALAVVDINMGCPARKIVSKGDGAALMRDEGLARSIVEAVSEAVDVPVSVKFRRGYDEGDETCVGFAQAMQEAGASWVCVHGRYAAQMYRGSSDRGCIARVKQAVDIPVVGNGDVRSGADCLALVQETGCDAVLVARGAQGNPWVFESCTAALSGLPEPPAPGPVERIEMARKHAHLLAEHDPRLVVRMRRHACWYVKGLCGASAARGRITQCSTVEEFDAVFDELLAKQESQEGEGHD